MNKSNVGRELTIRLIITDDKESEWLWNSHSSPMHGVRVSALANGDMFKERDDLAQAAEFFIREEGEETDDAVEAHFGEGLSSIEEAALAAPKNVEPGKKWDIIDRKGNVYKSGGGVE